MQSPLSPDAIDRLAHRRARAKIRWMVHALVFGLVNLCLFLASEHAFGSHPWSIKPFLAWGLGLTLHGVSVWYLGTGGEWRERMVAREKQRLLERNQHR